MELTGKRVAVLVEDLYQDLEVWYPALRLREAGVLVTFIGPAMRSYSSKHGYPVEADAAADDARASDLDAVVVPGGYAPDLMRRHHGMVRLVREASEQGKVLGVICHGGWMLASAGVLQGRRVTGFFAIKDDLVNAGAVYEDAEVIRDGNLVTSRQPEDLPAFCRTIIEALSGR